MKGEDYELIRVWSSQPFLCVPFLMHHLNFLARRKDGRLHDSAKLFFAEVGFTVDDVIVNCCVMLDAGSSGMLSITFFVQLLNLFLKDCFADAKPCLIPIFDGKI